MAYHYTYPGDDWVGVLIFTLHVYVPLVLWVGCGGFGLPAEQALKYGIFLWVAVYFLEPWAACKYRQCKAILRRT